MGKLTINGFTEFQNYIGKELGASPFIKVTQEQINKFADATLDHQWIHTNPVRAANGPFKSTIAHGYLILSLVPYLWEEIADIREVKLLVNYGIEKMKFNQPVMVNNEVRLRVSLKSLTDLRGITKAEMDIVMEIRDNPKPAFTATIIFLYHFNK